jgi:hypothetical protein
MDKKERSSYEIEKGWVNRSGDVRADQEVTYFLIFLFSYFSLGMMSRIIQIGYK